MEERTVETIDKAFLGHPKGVFTSSMLAAASAFSGYAMSAILIYYLYKTGAEGGLGFEKTQAAQFVAVYSSLSFMCGIIGSIVADRLLGMRKAIFMGQIFKLIGYGALCIPVLGRTGYFLSFAALIFGAATSGGSSVFNALAKKCYPEKDSRLDSGITLIYIFNNVGAVSPAISGAVADSLGYNCGFMVAFVVSLLGFIVYLLSEKKCYGEHGIVPDDPYPAEKRKVLFRNVVIVLAAAAVLAFALVKAGILTPELFTTSVSTLSIFVPAVYIWIIIKSKKTTREEAGRVKGFIFVFIAQVFNYMIWTQSTSILAIFAEERMNTTLFGFHISAATWQVVPAILAILFGPIAIAIWDKMGKRQPSTAMKMGIGTVLYGGATMFMALPYIMYGSTDIVSPIWLMVFYIVMIAGEVLTSPVGMACSAAVAPKAFSTQMVSVWLLSSSTGAGLSSLVTNFYTAGNESTYFLLIGGVTGILGVLLWVFSKKITRTTGMQ